MFVTAPPASVLTGMTVPQLQQALASAQAAYLALSTGSKAESLSYAQGDGSKSITFTRANVAQLTVLISQLQQALGLVPRARRPIRFLHT